MSMYELSPEEWEIILQMRNDRNYRIAFNKGLESAYKMCESWAEWYDNKAKDKATDVEPISSDTFQRLGKQILNYKLPED